jgi:hypothetical protein
MKSAMAGGKSFLFALDYQELEENEKYWAGKRRERSANFLFPISP